MADDRGPVLDSQRIGNADTIVIRPNDQDTIAAHEQRETHRERIRAIVGISVMAAIGLFWAAVIAIANGLSGLN